MLTPTITNDTLENFTEVKEVYYHIFSFLDIQDLVHLSGVSKQLNTRVKNYDPLGQIEKIYQFALSLNEQLSQKKIELNEKQFIKILLEQSPSFLRKIGNTITNKTSKLLYFKIVNNTIIIHSKIETQIYFRDKDLKPVVKKFSDPQSLYLNTSKAEWAFELNCIFLEEHFTASVKAMITELKAKKIEEVKNPVLEEVIFDIFSHTKLLGCKSINISENAINSVRELIRLELSKIEETELELIEQTCKESYDLIKFICFTIPKKIRENNKMTKTTNPW